MKSVMLNWLFLTTLSFLLFEAHGFSVLPTRSHRGCRLSPTAIFASPSAVSRQTRRARDLLQSLIVDQRCFSTDAGARAFADVCAFNVVYEDRFETQPIVGKLDVADHLLNKVAQRKGKGGVRLDKISDGDRACGFCWTWITDIEEGLRGTTFVELNDNGEIQFVAEIPEPIFKPGNLTLSLLKAVTADEKWQEFKPYTRQTPTLANEVVKYLFQDLQKADPAVARPELARFWSDQVIYRDFNFEEVLRGPDEVAQFVKDFSFPGIVFRPLRFDDGLDSTCFTWECVLGNAPDTIKGISFYEIDKDTRKIIYVRDVPESTIKPPILGKLARQLRPGLGVFKGVPLGSRPGGL